MYRIIFFGTSEIAVPSLTELARDGRFEILGVVTQPDRPVGRHAKITQSPITVTATQLGIPIFRPEKLTDEDFKTWITKTGSTCDAFVIISYGKILPQWLLDLPKHGVVNLHPSLLPRWRGPSPIQAAVAAGDTMTGISIMRIDADMDHGPLIAQIEEPITSTDTGSSLHDRLAQLGANILPGILANYLEGNVEPQEQDHARATFCQILTRDDGKLDASATAQELERRVRAYHSWPGTWTEFEGKRLKVHSAHVVDSPRADTPHLACADNTTLELVTVQPEGKRPMSGVDFLRGIQDKG